MQGQSLSLAIAFMLENVLNLDSISPIQAALFFLFLLAVTFIILFCYGDLLK